jgi:hypothetical protein
MSILVEAGFEGGDKQTLAALEKDLAALLAQEKELLRKYGLEHPEVLAAREKIDLTRNLAARPGRAWVRSTDQLAGKEYEAFVNDLVRDHLRSLRQQVDNIELEEAAFTDLAKSLEDEARTLVNNQIREEGF